MKVVVTGSSGFLGNYVTSELRAHGHVVIPLSHGGTSWDSLDLDEFLVRAKNAMNAADAVVHLAGIAHAKGSSEIAYEKGILQLTTTVFTAAIASRCKHFVYASSVKVYGSSSKSECQELDENSRCQPDSYYGLAKLKAEQFITAKSAVDHGLRTSILRFPPLYGRGTRGAIKFLIASVKYRLPTPALVSKAKRTILYAGNAATLVRGICEDALPPGIYLPVDGGCWTLSDLSIGLWRAIHGSAPSRPTLLIAKLSEYLLRPFLRRMRLLQDFCCASKRRLPWAIDSSQTRFASLMRGVSEHLSRGASK